MELEKAITIELSSSFEKKRLDKKAVRMNYLHLFDVDVLFLHPSAFRYAHRPTLHRDPAHHPNFI